MNTRIGLGLDLRTLSGLLCPVMVILSAAAVPAHGHVGLSPVMAFSANDEDPKPSGAKEGDPPRPRVGKKRRGGRRGRSPSSHDTSICAATQITAMAYNAVTAALTRRHFMTPLLR